MVFFSSKEKSCLNAQILHTKNDKVPGSSKIPEGLEKPDQKLFEKEVSKK